MQPIEQRLGDNDDTAELPVLDVAAYEASLDEDLASNTDTWVSPQPIALEAPVVSATNTGSQPELRSIPPAVDLGALGATLHAVEDRLRHKSERLIALEREVAEVRTERAAAVTASQTATVELESARDSLAQGQARIRDLERRVAELEEMRSILETGHEAALIRANTDIALYREQLQTRTETFAQRAEGLERDLEQTSTAYEVAARRMRELEAQMSAQAEELQIQSEQREAEWSRRFTERDNEWTARLAERDNDLRAAEDALRRLETDLRHKSVKLDEVAKSSDDFRSTIVEAQQALAERDQRIRQLEAEMLSTATAFGKLQQSIERLDPVGVTGEEVGLEGPQRLLIRADGNTDYVHVLTRRTRIGRGPDNDLLVEAQYISRNHAVVMAGPVNTTIEDLGSTNGVFVNGKRVTRQSLKDGDRVTIGRTQFRFAVRTLPDKNS
jgi:chromosome segregation ATPase